MRYLEQLRELARQMECVVHAHVLMSNPLLPLQTPSASGRVGALMQAPGRRYVRHIRYINDRYHRTGTLWEGRYMACPVDSESDLLRCYRHIELNPLRAAMVAAPGEHPAVQPWRRCTRPIRCVAPA